MLLTVPLVLAAACFSASAQRANALFLVGSKQDAKTSSERSGKTEMYSLRVAASQDCHKMLS